MDKKTADYIPVNDEWTAGEADWGNVTDDAAVITMPSDLPDPSPEKPKRPLIAQLMPCTACFSMNDSSFKFCWNCFQAPKIPWKLWDAHVAQCDAKAKTLEPLVSERLIFTHQPIVDFVKLNEERQQLLRGALLFAEINTVKLQDPDLTLLEFISKHFTTSALSSAPDNLVFVGILFDVRVDAVLPAWDKTCFTASMHCKMREDYAGLFPISKLKVVSDIGQVDDLIFYLRYFAGEQREKLLLKTTRVGTRENTDMKLTTALPCWRISMPTEWNEFRESSSWKSKVRFQSHVVQISVGRLVKSNLVKMLNYDWDFVSDEEDIVTGLKPEKLWEDYDRKSSGKWLST